jgi:hypothetical protein
MTITVYVEKKVLDSFYQFIQGIDEETNGTIIRRHWHLDLNTPKEYHLVGVQLSYDNYIKIADNE